MAKPPKRILLLGTGNRKKGEELARLLAPHGLLLKTLADIPDAMTVVEDGDTFAANARKKASQQARHLGQWVLGEDSGIEVDALGGRPGVYSARYAGEQATDEENNRLLLDELADLPPPRRTAHYVCCAALSDPGGKIRIEHQGQCYGRIRHEPAGEGGFGYDPLFEIPEYHRTFGQIGPEVKRVLSHRGRALRRMLPEILRLAASDDWPAAEASLHQPLST